MKKGYVEFEIHLVSYVVEGDVLATSVFQKSDVSSSGQEVTQIDFSSDDFSHEWGSSATY